jgi:hypoxia up-regulated 1
LLEEARNKVESYIYFIKNKLVDDETLISAVTNEAQRDECHKLAVDGADWLDNESYGADLATMEDKYAEISVPFENILLRVAELTKRPASIEKVNKRLDDMEALMSKWETEKTQVTDEERKSVLNKIEEVKKWLDEKETAQSKRQAHEHPAFLSDEVLMQLMPIESLVVKLGRKPKPIPPKIETNTTIANEPDVDQADMMTNTSSTNDSNVTDNTTNITDSNTTDTMSNATIDATVNSTSEQESVEDEL